MDEYSIPERGRSKLVIAVSVSLRIKKNNKRRQLNMNENYRIYLRDWFQQVTEILSLKKYNNGHEISYSQVFFMKKKGDINNTHSNSSQF